VTSPLKLDPEQALQRLRDGNRRFVSGNAKRFSEEEVELRQELASGQAPDAVVLTCADSRVPPSLVFDHGLGDLFVVRIAGNVVTPEVLGSVEFAVESLGASLVLVLGHTGCGAVTAAVDLLGPETPEVSANLLSITDRIRPAAERAVAEAAHGRVGGEGSSLTGEERDGAIRRAIRLNVTKAMEDLLAGSPILRERNEGDGLMIVGAEYRLEDGAVDFLQ